MSLFDMNLFDDNLLLPRTQPTPEQLADWMTLVGADTRATEEQTQAAVAKIVYYAEAGGTEHMAAVAGVIASIPNGPPPPNAPVYEAASGRPAWHENNILMSATVRIDGRVYTARESLDPMLLDLQFGGTDTDRFESFVGFFLKKSFGQIATADDASYRFLRNRVWIVKPGDEHDQQRCHDSYHVQPPYYPRCTMGIITSAPFEIVPGEYDEQGRTQRPGYAQVGKDKVLGQCPCRCHRKDFHGNGAKRFAALNGLAVFDELMVDEKGEQRADPS